MRHAVLFCALSSFAASAIGLAGCSKSANKDAAGGAAAAASASTNSASSAAAATASGPGQEIPPPPGNLASIEERFAGEAKNRPSGTPRVEDAFDAFTKAGANVHDKRQHLARPFGAMYCLGGQTGQKIFFGVCEYQDAAAATAGREQSLKGFGKNRRDIWQNKATTLTIRRGDDNADDKELEKKLVDAFQKLAAPAAPAASK